MNALKTNQTHRWIIAACLALGVTGFYAADGRARPRVNSFFCNTTVGSGNRCVETQDSRCPAYFGGVRGFDSNGDLVCTLENSGYTASAYCISNNQMNALEVSIDVANGSDVNMVVAPNSAGGDCPVAAVSWGSGGTSVSCNTAANPFGQYPNCPSLDLSNQGGSTN